MEANERTVRLSLVGQTLLYFRSDWAITQSEMEDGLAN
ncbi:MAG: hypothetical protein JWN92_196 [Candidatus Acidoferrum typicum]|nr:hypothetical protein [Candidatus Acidoferrum typicum]